MSTRPRTLVAMSGGVDSAVAAALLRDLGHEVIGLHMRVYHLQGGQRSFAKSCCSPADIADAQAVARQLDIPFYVLDLEQDFERDVIQPFIEDYRAGKTPIPCVQCNEHLKLGRLLEKTALYGAQAVATGHYVRVVSDADGTPRLARPHDRSKDQTYYLFSLTPEQLSGFLTPLGDLTKDQVREMAADLGLRAVASKPDSVEICFTAGGDYRDFLRARLKPDDPALQEGAFVTADGKRVGTHRGYANYTVGQRRGLDLPLGEPVYVLALRPETNEVVVGPADETFHRGLTAQRVIWHEPPENLTNRRLHIQIRARHDGTPGTLTPLGGDRFDFTFEDPERSVAPGQAAVVFDENNDTVVAGGWIE